MERIIVMLTNGKTIVIKDCDISKTKEEIVKDCLSDKAG